jgi:apolipoprotein D and lipocalin family protein
VVDDLDLDRYQGQWHEVARLPNRFQEGCQESTANCQLTTDNEVLVTNRCVRDDSQDSAEAIAWSVGPEAGKLRVQFFWPFSGDYWVIALDPQYHWAMVGEPSRNYLWILSRTPELDPVILHDLTKRAAELDFDVNRLILAHPKVSSDT